MVPKPLGISKSAAKAGPMSGGEVRNLGYSRQVDSILGMYAGSADTVKQGREGGETVKEERGSEETVRGDGSVWS